MIARRRQVRSVSIYFFAGDFVDVLHRYAEGREQTYATHDEVARLIHELHDEGIALTVYSFVTPAASEHQPLPGVRIVSIGARGYSDEAALLQAFRQDEAEAIVVHFPNRHLLHAAIRSGRPTASFLASSFNRTGLLAWLRRNRTVNLLNHPSIELVCNHCFPATDQLARLGVSEKKLLAWDVPHRYGPGAVPPKQLASGRRHNIAYAGSLSEAKGVGDLIRALAFLRGDGLDIACSLAGLGDMDAMKALANRMGVADMVTFRGQIGNADVSSMFGAADLVAVPSRPEFEEGFPLVMFEAIASRTPIVCSDHPVFTPVMLDRQRAIVFRAGDSRSMAVAIRAALADPSTYALLSRNAEASWAALKEAADWRTLIKEWVLRGPDTPWIREQKRARVTRSQVGPDAAEIRGSAAGA